ncbi:putative membrane protein [Salsuginibacillus halophilus]|uniref:Putative membrane protein n=1 Tax=Salsuginibacillus halophilus TaxID=517424 RepID=A0A2P8HAN2_9BACI|nr:carotenoid biosynthesis protein [Salsuginibacillus halophilus]PSL43270.1 putative membrane protein [Salsuginibacillus halophilus]
MKLDQSIFRLFLFWYTVGVILLAFDLVPPPLEWANVVFLILCGVLGCFYLYRHYSSVRGTLAIVIIFFLSMVIEAIGVQTGLFFGNYTYASDFGPGLIGVPITIGAAWVMVLSTTHAIAKPFARQFQGRFVPFFIYIITGSLLAVGIDLVIDPVAYEMKGYWLWDDGGTYYGVPFSNFLGWWILSLVLHALLWLLLHKEPAWNERTGFWEPRTRLLFFLIMFMFTFLCVVGGLWLAAVLGTAVMAAAGMMHQFSRRQETGI